MRDIADLRQQYRSTTLLEADAPANPLELFGAWLDEAIRSGLREPTAMTLATATSAGVPSARMVLLKGFDDEGFRFFTNYESHKAGELEKNPRCALVFYWDVLERQVRVRGVAQRTSREVSEAYFRRRPRRSRLSALASPQSAVIPGREVLEQRVADLDAAYPDQEIPLPEYWGGYCVRPESVEFWQGRPDRLHDRLLYVRDDGGYKLSRLAP
ncbi:MAG: pyridoxamine 5'-phosphate oxidase [Bryobacteraceae bacterium]|nr:pyridoxamine 5'-phosphate oxidase [Bryobacteraceae bacterium]